MSYREPLNEGKTLNSIEHVLILLHDSKFNASSMLSLIVIHTSLIGLQTTRCRLMCLATPLTVFPSLLLLEIFLAVSSEM